MYLCRNHSLADGTCELVHFAAEMKSKMKEDWLGEKALNCLLFAGSHRYIFLKKGVCTVSARMFLVNVKLDFWEKLKSLVKMAQILW